VTGVSAEYIAAAAALIGLQNGSADVYVAAGVSVAIPLQLLWP